MGRGRGDDATSKAGGLLFAPARRRPNFASLLRSRDERCFVEVFGQEFRDGLATLAEQTTEYAYPEGHGRIFRALAPRRCDRSYREDMAELPHIAEPDDELVFTVHVYFPKRPGWSGPVLDRSAEIRFTPEELANLGWASEAFHRRCREEAMKGAAD